MNVVRLTLRLGYWKYEISFCIDKNGNKQIKKEEPRGLSVLLKRGTAFFEDIGVVHKASPPSFKVQCVGRFFNAKGSNTFKAFDPFG